MFDGVPSAHELAQRLGISEAAVALTRASHFIDLHLDSFIPTRLWGYDLHASHAPLLGGRFFTHLDFPRARAAGMTGGLWCITTNPFRGAASRRRVFEKNLARLCTIIAAHPENVRVVKNAREYDEAQRDSVHACFMCVQGANCLGALDDFGDVDPEGLVVSVTLVHLTSSEFGETSTPVANRFGPRGLTDRGRKLVHGLNARRIFVDLAHISPAAFADVVAVHDKTQPLINTHTGVSGVAPHWRNMSDGQLKQIAETGGVVGIIFERSYLRHAGGPRDAGMVVEHMDHAIRVVGEDFVAVGTDYDGAITPPDGLEDGLALPRVVEAMLQRGWSEERVRKVLGDNFLRAFRMLRPG